MSGLSAILGDKLLGKSGELPTAGALAGKKAVAIYFSAHWCPPCRGFTPKLGEWYTKDLKAKGLEVVFVSSDKDETSFNEYYGEMPWLALPFHDRSRKDTLSKKYKVQGIPSLVIVGPDGETITTDGRSAVSSDPTGDEMPWKPKTFKELFDDAKVVGKDGQTLRGSDLAGKVLALYFSAHWCPPCRGFTPQLATWYKNDLKAKGLEVVFISSDRDESAFKEYYGEQPWLALAFEERKLKEQLSNTFSVQGIPTLVILDKDGSVITKDGRAALSGDPTGAEFPWYPKPVANLKAGPGSLQELPTLLVFCETSDASAQSAIENTMTPFAVKYIDEGKAKNDDPEIAFMIVTAGEGLGGRVREMLSLPTLDSGKKSAPKMMLLDLQDEGAYYEGPEGDVTENALKKFLDDFSSGKLVCKRLS